MSKQVPNASLENIIDTSSESLKATVIPSIHSIDSLENTTSSNSDRLTPELNNDSTSSGQSALPNSNATSLDTTAIADSIAVDTMSADTSRYMIVHGDTVYLGRSGYTGTVKQEIDSTKQSKNALEAIVEYSAKDSVTFDYKNDRVNFYGDAHVNYTNLELSANLITMSVDSSIVHAVGTRDSLGNMLTPPIFKQGDMSLMP